MTSSTVQLKPYAARLRQHQPFLLVLVVFLTFRLLLPFVFRNGSYFVEQAPDIGDYLRWGVLADGGLYPFVHYWSEYPPLFAWSIIGLYRLSTLLPAWIDQRLWFSIIMQLTMVAADTASLLLVYLSARHIGSRARAVRTSALFAASFIMAYAASGWYESVPIFLTLLALYLALRDHFGWSMVFSGIGFLTKIVPIVIVPAVLKRMRGVRQQVTHLVELGAVILALLLPFIWAGFDQLVAFVRVTMNRPTWLSIWALFDGNYQYGATLPMIDRFSPANLGTPSVSVLPWPLIHLAFLAIGMFVFTRQLDWRAPRNTIAFAGLTTNLLLLWSKGFSGQFIAYSVPFIALLLPNLRGVFYLALLSVLWVAEWPLAYQMLDGQTWFLAWLIIIRTVVLIILTVEFAAQMFSRLKPRALRVTRYVLLLCWLTVPVVVVAAISNYTQARLAADPAAPAIEMVREQGTKIPLVFADTKLYRRLYPAAQPLGEVLLLPPDKHVPEEMRLKWLNDLTARGPFWLIADEGDPESVEANRKAHEFVSKQVCKVDTQWSGSALVSRFVGRNGTPLPVQVSAVFGDQIELTGAQLYPSTLRSGGTLCVELDWRMLKMPDGDYTVFVHLVDSNGQVVAQTDMPPQGGFAPTSQWQTNTTLSDKHGLILPDNLPAGEYTVRLGLYRSDDQTPLSITQGNTGVPHALVLAKMIIAP